MDVTTWRNRITRYRPAVPVSELQGHPLNARDHPEFQRRALQGALNDVGWVMPVIFSSNSGRIVDGHLRVEEALNKGPRETVPVIDVDLSEDEERYVLATADAIGALAELNETILSELIDGIEIIADDTVSELLAGMATLTLPSMDSPLPNDPTVPPEDLPPSQFADVGFEEGDEEGFEIKAIILSYDRDCYDDIMDALANLPGETNAEKIAGALGVQCNA